MILLKNNLISLLIELLGLGFCFFFFWELLPSSMPVFGTCLLVYEYRSQKSDQTQLLFAIISDPRGEAQIVQPVGIFLCPRGL